MTCPIDLIDATSTTNQFCCWGFYGVIEIYIIYRCTKQQTKRNVFACIFQFRLIILVAGALSVVYGILNMPIPNAETIHYYYIARRSKTKKTTTATNWMHSIYMQSLKKKKMWCGCRREGRKGKNIPHLM